MTSETPWRKSNYSGSNCVEVAEAPTTGVRDTQYRGLVELDVLVREWNALFSALPKN
ncbi:DUF397 domain-containing protein [Nocardiopsis alba]|uniref:DUF397 domain-containing protein n=1 Tax=Nocardiopsis alba TaxID=53437 RepID=UPI0033E5FC6D